MPDRDEPPSGLAHKLSLYALEAALLARVSAPAADRWRLLLATLRFHHRNWRRRAPDPIPRLTLDIDLSGRRSSFTLRPHDADLAIFYEVFAMNAYQIADEALPPASVLTILDAGANIGCSALYFAARYPAARIVAVEPNPENFALLCANTAHESRIAAIKACVTPLPDQQVFIATAGRASHFKSNDRGDGAPIRGMSIGQIADQCGLDRIDLLKMDVEGAEREIFAEPAFLQRVGAIVAELHGSYGLERLDADLAPWGLAARRLRPQYDPSLVVATRDARQQRRED